MLTVMPTHKNSIDDEWWNPAILLAGVFLLTIFEGALRKWVFNSNFTMRYATYFSKDILFAIAAYVGMRRGAAFDMSWFVVCAALIILPSLGSTLASFNPVAVLLALRAYLLVPACAYLAAPLIRDFRDIQRCALLVALSAMAVALLSIYQYHLPVSHILNRYDSGMEVTHITAEGGHVRATGTFAYISGMSMMAGVSGWAGTFLALPLAGRSLWLRLIGLGAILSGYVCSATSMSRGALAFWAVSFIGGCLLYLRPRQILVILLTICVIAPFLGGEADDGGEDSPISPNSITAGLAYRLEHGDSFTDRGGYMLNNLLLGMSRYPLGEGLGIGQPGGAYAAGLGRRSGVIESEWGRITFEIGILGLAATLFIRFSTFRLCLMELVRNPTDHTRLVLATVLPFFGIISLGWMVFNHTGNSFAWSVIGLGLGAILKQSTQAETH
jgi:hypothetical protein